MIRFKISAADRALIEQHIARHGVTVCPPNTFSEDLDISLKSQRKATYNNIARGRRIAAAKTAAIEKSEPVSNLRIAELRAQGVKFTEIGAMMGISGKVAAKRYYRMKERTNE